MSPQKADLEKKRRDVLERLRGNRGAPRHGEDRTHRFDHLGEYLEPFLQMAEGPGKAGQEDVKGVLDAIKRARHKTPGDESGAPAEEANWQELIGEIGLENFKDSVQRWLASVPVEHGQDETPIEDLERLSREARLRLRLLTKLVDFTQQEIDDIEVSLRASVARAAAAQ